MDFTLMEFVWNTDEYKMVLSIYYCKTSTQLMCKPQANVHKSLVIKLLHVYIRKLIPLNQL